MVNVIIVDSVPKDRWEELAAICLRCWPGIRVCVHARRSKNEPAIRELTEAGAFKSDGLPNTFNIILRHYRDSIPTSKTFGVSREMEFFYGGNGAELGRGKDLNHIYPNLGTGSDVRAKISERDLREMLTWAVDPQRKRLALPALLRPEASSELLHALAILCQGYLCAHGEGVVGQAFEKVATELRAEAKNKASLTEEATWWSAVFNGAGNQKRLTKSNVVTAWREALADSHPAIRLLAEIKSDSKVTRETVEQAYEELRARLVR